MMTFLLQFYDEKTEQFLGAVFFDMEGEEITTDDVVKRASDFGRSASVSGSADRRNSPTNTRTS